ncbi:MAG: DegT/DnrJ/EryC1/StrS aminotransferase family protein [Microvirga sp.]|nr:DegT/DnrJ/EryC1/StrS aminotransferase family protein [Microvirga sp.]
MLNTPFAPWPSFTQDEIDAVSRVLASNRVNYWTGEEGRAFEREFAAWCGTDHAIALANGSLAIELALRGIGVGPGDDVIVAPRTFVASASSAPLVGARPVFADVDPVTQGLSAETIEAALTPETRAVICVHIGGMPCDMDPIMDLAGRRGFAVIEDCAQAHGAVYKGRKVGAIGHVGAWSFCQDKIMTTGGEGGMVTTNDREVWSRMWSFKDHGKSWEAVYETRHPPGFRWLHHSVGSNYRMLEMQAVIGRIQLGRMEAWTARRNAIAAQLRAVCQRHPHVSAPPIPEDVIHAHYRFYAFVDPDALAPGWTRDRIVAEIVARGAPCLQGSCSEVYLERAFDPEGWRPAERLPMARRLGETSLAMLTHPTLTDADVDAACAALDGALAASAPAAAPAPARATLSR